MTPGSDDPTDGDARSASLRRTFVAVTVVGVVLGVLGVLIGSVGAVARVLPGTDDDQGERDAVVSAVTDYVTVYNTYDVNEVADYQRRMKPLLTASYYAQFKRVTDALFQALEGKKQKSGDAKVLSIAVQSIDDDSATALVAVDSEISTDGEAAVARRFRWKIAMERDGGDWLVRNQETVTTGDATTGQAGSGQTGTAPSATPSPSASGGQ